MEEEKEVFYFYTRADVVHRVAETDKTVTLCGKNVSARASLDETLEKHAEEQRCDVCFPVKKVATFTVENVEIVKPAKGVII